MESGLIPPFQRHRRIFRTVSLFVLLGVITHFGCLILSARGPMCDCGCENDWKHCPRHLSSPVHVCCHWSPALQGNYAISNEHGPKPVQKDLPNSSLGPESFLLEVRVHVV